jgi:hypothetical protein
MTVCEARAQRQNERAVEKKEKPLDPSEHQVEFYCIDFRSQEIRCSRDDLLTSTPSLVAEERNRIDNERRQIQAKTTAQALTSGQPKRRR